MSNSYRIHVFIFAFLLLVDVLPAVAAHGAEAPDQAPQLEFNSLETDTDGFHRLPQEQIPLSELVRGIFPAISRYLDDNVFRAEKLHKSFGFEEGSSQEAALVRAILAASDAEPDEAEVARKNEDSMAILEAKGRDAYMRAIREISREEARQLGMVWGQFVADLGGPASPAMVKVREFLESHRRGISIGSSESFDDPNNSLWVNERAFQQAVESVSLVHR
jgi:hypothetical protein